MKISFKDNLLFIYLIVTLIISFIAWSIILSDMRNNISSYTKLQRIFLEQKYNLEDIRNKIQNVPKIFLTQIPKDFNMIETIIEKKDLFIKSILPLIIQKNSEVIKQRQRLINIDNKLKNKKLLSLSDKYFLNKLQIEYKTFNIDKLLIKVDEVPVSIALAQSIQETGWGTSRFLLNGNALFAEWTWGGRGIIPNKRDKGLKHKVKTFKSLSDSVNSYINNINQNRSYAGFRNIRNLIKNNKNKDTNRLIDYLTKYSTENSYTKKIKQIIIDNKLEDFNDIKM